jgi:DNA replication protein DnaC
MTLLHEKLQRLKLPVMSRQLDQALSDAAAKNWSTAQTLERLADLELEDRNGRAVERRFRLSRLQVQYSMDAFNFQHHKSRLQSKARILRLLDLDFIAQGTNLVLIGNPGTGKTSWPRSSAGAPARPTTACCSPLPWTCSTTCWLRRPTSR